MQVEDILTVIKIHLSELKNVVPAIDILKIESLLEDIVNIAILSEDQLEERDRQNLESMDNLIQKDCIAYADQHFAKKYNKS